MPSSTVGTACSANRSPDILCIFLTLLSPSYRSKLPCFSMQNAEGSAAWKGPDIPKWKRFYMPNFCNCSHVTHFQYLQIQSVHTNGTTRGIDNHNALKHQQHQHRLLSCGSSVMNWHPSSYLTPLNDSFVFYITNKSKHRIAWHNWGKPIRDCCVIFFFFYPHVVLLLQWLQSSDNDHTSAISNRWCPLESACAVMVSIGFTLKTENCWGCKSVWKR